MAITTQTVKVDLNTGSQIPVVYASQNDTNRSFVFQMFNNGASYTMTGATVKFAYRSPRKKGAYIVIAGSEMASGTVSGSKVTFNVPVSYLKIAGEALLTMIITNSSATLRPVNIKMIVQRSADGDDTIAESSDFPVSLEKFVEDSAGNWFDEHGSSLFDEWLSDNGETILTNEATDWMDTNADPVIETKTNAWLNSNADDIIETKSTAWLEENVEPLTDSMAFIDKYIKLTPVDGTLTDGKIHRNSSNKMVTWPGGYVRQVPVSSNTDYYVTTFAVINEEGFALVDYYGANNTYISSEYPLTPRKNVSLTTQKLTIPANAVGFYVNGINTVPKVYAYITPQISLEEKLADINGFIESVKEKYNKSIASVLSCFNYMENSPFFYQGKINEATGATVSSTTSCYTDLMESNCDAGYTINLPESFVYSVYEYSDVGSGGYLGKVLSNESGINHVPIPKTNYIRVVVSKANGTTITTDEITDYEFKTFIFD